VTVKTHTCSLIFSGGGTGGHLYPLLAIADEIKTIRPGTSITFIGTKRRIEARVVPEKGYTFHSIWISGFQRRLTWSNLLFPVKVVVALIQSLILLRRYQPAVVVGTGGYVCGPVLYAAALMRIPTVVHESNSYPGVTTRMLAGKVTKLLLTFPVTTKWLKGDGSNIEVVGNPTRIELGTKTRDEGIRYYGLDPAKKTLLVFGGSLGAESINRAMKAIIDDAIVHDYQIIWQTGERNAEKLFLVQPHPNVKVRKFIDTMEYAYAAADAVVCRAGATTLAELTRLGKAAILVPYPRAAANHQVMNAESLAGEGAALMVKDEELSAKLLESVRSLLNDELFRRNIEDRCRTLGKPNAGRDIAEKILSLA
jgi:UDP-N-acetylglucosamine--N-acetylmuramyl-(pentapeptide) pyrophosphoryl-undecaprenol N-acetylglucosamine transferase